MSNSVLGNEQGSKHIKQWTTKVKEKKKKELSRFSLIFIWLEKARYSENLHKIG